MTQLTTDEKIGHWDRAFQALREAIVPNVAREFVANGANVQDVASLRSYQAMAHTVAAGDRAAAIAAAILVASPTHITRGVALAAVEEEEPGGPEA